LEELDHSVAAYFNASYAARGGVGKGAASHCLNGLRFYLPFAKGSFPHAQQALDGWNKSRPKKSYPPLTWSLTVAIAVQMARHGRGDMGVATLLAFDALMRVTELTSLMREDLVFGDQFDARVDDLYRQSGARIRKAKTGTEQWCEILRPTVRNILRQYASTRFPGQSLFGFSSAEYRRFFKRICAELGLSPTYVPHSLRHGGATLLFLLGVHMDRILIRGRWSERKSARIYIQRGRALLLAMSVPIDVARAGQFLAKHLIRAFAEATGWVRAR
jgi:integrase